MTQQGRHVYERVEESLNRAGITDSDALAGHFAKVANNEPLFVQCVGNIVASFREWIQAEGRTFDDAFFFAVENIVGDLVRDVAARYQGMSEEMQKILAELAAEPRQDEDMRAHRALPEDDPFHKEHQEPEEPAEENTEDEIPTLITEVYIQIYARVVELIEEQGLNGRWSEEEIMEIVKTLIVFAIYQIISSGVE